MYKFIKLQYLLGKGKKYVIRAYEKELITKEEMEDILGE